MSPIATTASSPKTKQISEQIWQLAMFGASISEMQQALDADGDLEAFDRRGQRALHMAAHRRDPTCVLWLAERGAKINERDIALGNTALHVACSHGDAPIAKILLDAGADPNIVNHERLSPAFKRHMNDEILTLLCRHGLDLDIQNELGSLLHHATLGPGSSTINRLIGLGATIDLPNAQGWSPLMMAASKGQAMAVDTLLLAGANPHATANDGQGPLSIAAMAQRHAAECMDLLIKAGCRITGKDMELAKLMSPPEHQGTLAPAPSPSIAQGLAKLHQLCEIEKTAREIALAIGETALPSHKPRI